jgi:hypothetical protein
MSEAEGETGRGRRWRRGSLAAASLFAVAVGLLWTQRGPLAEQVIHSELQKRGIAASYRLVAIGPGAATLETVTLGPRDRPDLVAGKARLGLRWGWRGPTLDSLQAERVVLRGRWDDKGLSLGSIDRLLPTSTGAPFALPDIDLSLSRIRVELETPAGPLALDVDGGGNPADRFTGRAALRAVGPRIGDCRAELAAGTFQLATGRGEIGVTGPLGVTDLRCGAADQPAMRVGSLRATVDLLIPQVLQTLRGGLGVAATDLAAGGATAASATYDGTVEGRLDGTVLALNGTAALRDASAPDALRRDIVNAGSGLDALPVGPVARKATAALAGALARADILSRVDGRILGGSGTVTLRQPRVRARNGATIDSDEAMAVTLSWPLGVRAVDGQLQIAGGGLPTIAMTVIDGERAGQWSAQVSAMSYSAGNARLAARPFFVGIDENGWRASGSLKVDGPLAGGRIEGLALPVSVENGGDGGLSVFPGKTCLNLAFSRLDIGGIALGPHRLPICRSQQAGPLVRIGARGQLSGGGSIGNPAITARMGQTPLAIAARRIDLRLAGSTARPAIGLGLATPSLRLGDGDDATRAAAERLALDFTGGGATGKVSGLSGKLAGVPLLIDQAELPLRIANGALTANGGTARIQDAATPIRFTPMRAQGVTLRYADNRLTGDAAIAHIETAAVLGRVDLVHDFGAQGGKAALGVPGIAFGSAMQPDDLTPLTRGVVANVSGVVQGRGEVRWNQAGVTSDGVFSSDGLALAAAFGPVTGLKREIRFSDLLGLATPPGQVATMAEVNPGVAVQNGVVNYQLLPGLKVQVEGGRWPFAGGELVLEPTLLDFSQPSERHFTFRVVGLDAARFVQQLEFKNFAASGLFDGVLPMVFTVDGGSIVGGRLVARKSGGTLAYVGELSEAEIGSAGKLAFDALKSMRYSALVIELDGALDGEIISSVVFNGTNQAPVDITGTSFAPRLTGLPFKFNIRVQAPFRGLLNTARSFTNVSASFLQSPPGAPVQPSDSEETR